MPEKKQALIFCYRCATYRIVNIDDTDKFDSNECSVDYINESTRIPEDTIIISDNNYDVLMCPGCGIDRI